MKLTLNILADPKLEKSLTELQSLETSVQETEKKVDKYRHDLLQPIYDRSISRISLGFVFLDPIILR